MFNWFDKKKKEKEELEASITMLSKKRSEITQENIALQEQLTDLRKEVQKESSLLDDKRATNCSLQQQNAELQKELDHLENKKKESLDYIQNKENECSILNQKQEKIIDSLHVLEKTVSERKLEIKELDKSIFIKKDELNTTIKDIDNIRKHIRKYMLRQSAARETMPYWLIKEFICMEESGGSLCCRALVLTNIFQ